MLRKPLKILLILALLLFLLQLGLYLYHEWRKPEPVAPIPPPPIGNVESPVIRQEPLLGINTNEISYNDASIPFIDLFRSANPFQENILRLKAEKVTYDANGWPNNLNGGEVGTRFLGELPPDTILAGEYTVLYDGDGEIRYGNDAVLVNHQPGRDTITLDAGTNERLDASLIIARSNPDDYLRNIRILPPGGICQNNPFQRVADASACSGEAGMYLSFVDHYSSIVFNPDYLDFMKDFGAIRFMPMSGITRNPEAHWQDRPSLDEATWGGTYGARGTPLEVMVDLANRLHKDAWFNIPHAADDDYVREYAAYVRDHLNPELKIYLEYSNEIWNTNFNHGEYTQKKGIEMALGLNAADVGYEYYTIRAREIFAAWEQVFGGRERFVRVLGGWDTRPDFAEKILSYDDTYKQVDALAIAPYFGGNIKGYREATTVDDIFELTTAKDSYRSLPEVLEKVQKHAELAAKFGVDLLGYEGGQGLVDWATRKPDQHPNPLFFAANRDPRMGELYTEFLNGWGKAGGKLMMLFSAPRICQWYGCWGLKEYIRQPREQAPKYAAVLDFIAKHPASVPTPTPPKPAQNPLATAPRNPDDPVIVWRPAFDPERVFFIENPITLDLLLEGNAWDKRNLFGKWQGRWDDDSLFLTVRVYDSKRVWDSEDPEEDDSVGFLIDTDNSRDAKLDGRKDFHLIFACDRDQVVLAKDSAPLSAAALRSIRFDTRELYDGYVLEAWIPWQALGMKPAIKDRVSVNVEVNDDDDGGARDGKIAWMAQDKQALTDPKQWGVVLFSGR
ncbi:sugar-binding protein [Thiothrix lacustris]|uniref:Sugar-binding protein n=1 Tax=Thiothrix lacustris TaxID=525917 RepID=A0ABY9MQI8_9GAMM|nr:sugar-binding protein [Thiothrix lacustris]WML90091.1 sugar-binding protein [Thiothrix lacustris]